jgi:hypothetical protein
MVEHSAEPLYIHFSLAGFVTIEFTVQPDAEGFRCVLEAHQQHGGGILTLERRHGSLPEYVAWLDRNINRIGMAIAMVCDSPHSTAAAMALTDMVGELRKGSPNSQRHAVQMANSQPTLPVNGQQELPASEEPKPNEAPPPKRIPAATVSSRVMLCTVDGPREVDTAAHK